MGLRDFLAIVVPALPPNATWRLDCDSVVCDSVVVEVDGSGQIRIAVFWTREANGMPVGSTLLYRFAVYRHTFTRYLTYAEGFNPDQVTCDLTQAVAEALAS